MAQHEIQRLLPRHYEILRLCLMGLSTKDIALAIDMTPVGVGLIINSPLFQDELARRREVKIAKEDELETQDALNILEKASSKAAQKHVDLLDSKSERTAQSSANAILDRVIQSKQGMGNVIQLDKAVINLLQITIKEIREADYEPNVPKVERADAMV